MLEGILKCLQDVFSEYYFVGSFTPVMPTTLAISSYEDV